MIAITGATGQLGRLVLDALLQRVPANELIALVRDPAKARDLATRGVAIRRADYNAPDTLREALAGVERLLLISSNELGQRTAQHRAVIQAAKAAGVKLLAYTSVLRADTSVLGLAVEHRDTEAALAASGVPGVLLRNGWYSENYAAGIPAATAHGAMLGCAQQGRIASASRADYALAAAVVLTSEGQAGKVYELAGDNAYTLDQLAAEIGTQAGKDVVYKDLSQQAYREALLGFGLPEGLAGLLSDSDAGAAQGALFDDSKALSQLISRPTTPIAQTVRDALRAN